MNFLNLLKEKIVIFDGAMGTSLQKQELTVDDYGGKEFEGCNEYLILSKPDSIGKVHQSFLESGCDIVETNTFGANRIVLSEYKLEDKCFDLNFRSAKLAKEIAYSYSFNSNHRYVAGSIGPSTKLPSLGHISFDDMEKVYYEQISGLIEGGVDMLICETVQDMLQAKIVYCSIGSYFQTKKIKIPVIFSFTFERTGSMLLGTDIASLLTTFEPFDIIDVIGINCATGPKEMSENVRYLSLNSPKPLLVMPNAGIPENVNGKSHYNLTPEELNNWMLHFVNDLKVSAIGGCCGTTAEHIKLLADTFKDFQPKERKYNYTPGVSSSYSSSPMQTDPAPILVGEKCNANGSKRFRELLAKDDYEGILSIAKEQVKEGAHILDVCAAYVGRDESKDMKEIIKKFNTSIPLPLMIDTTEVTVMEEALRLYSGRAILNSVNLEDGEEKMGKIFLLCKKYGAAVIALTIDEEGMAKTFEKKIQIVDRIYNLAINKFELKAKDLIFDTLTFTLGSGDEELRKAGMESLKAVKSIKNKYPDCYTILGVSNISFGLPPKVRNILNSVFLHHAIEYGLDMAIVNAQKILPLFKIEPKARELSTKLIFDERIAVEV
jgi:5-methyltetrahydrofolate--homocysteine methyltransferase